MRNYKDNVNQKDSNQTESLENENADDLKWKTVTSKKKGKMGQANPSEPTKPFKRKREDKSNETPPPKRAGKNELGLPLQQQNHNKTKRRFLYAEIAKEANELIIVRKNGDHISLDEWNKTIKILDTDYVSRMSSSVGKWIPTYEGRRYTNKRAVIYINDDASAKYVRKIIATSTPLLTTSWAEAEEMRNARKGKKMLTGFIRGITGDIIDDILAKIIKHQCTIRGIEGKVEVAKSDLTQLGKVLYLSVDQQAFKSLQLVDFTLHIASAGKVRFQDPRDAPTVEEKEETVEKDDIELDDNKENKNQHIDNDRNTTEDGNNKKIKDTGNHDKNDRKIYGKEAKYPITRSIGLTESVPKDNKKQSKINCFFKKLK